jgi:hypothetical protein
MVIARLKGGLGNQMFQYAAARRLAVVTRQPLKLDLEFLEQGQLKENVTLRSYDLSIFNIEENFITPEERNQSFNFGTRLKSKLFGALYNGVYIKEKQEQFDESILYLKGSRYLDGHWMSELYFNDVEDIIRKDFSFKKELSQSAKSLSNDIQAANSVCVHVRRGDYVYHPKVKNVYKVLNLKYFINAVSIIKEKMENPVFFVFSDDIEWCYKNLTFLGSPVFVEREIQNSEKGDFFHLMTTCKSFIISNSTYSWWAAWLGSNQAKIVVAPESWLIDSRKVRNDLYPKEWIRLNDEA